MTQNTPFNGKQDNLPQVKIVEKRNGYRRPYLAEIFYGNDDENGKGRIRDLSTGGVFVASERKVPIGSEILVTLPFARSVRFVSLKGVVVRHTEDGFAIAFQH